jgi:hypothetical protein
MAGLGWQELVIFLLIIALFVYFAFLVVRLVVRREQSQRDRESPD